MDNLSGAAMSKVVLQQGKLDGEPIPPGHKELVNARTVKDLENVRDTGLAKKIDIEDLQFMIRQDGSITLIDPARVTFLEQAGLKKRVIEARLDQFENRMNLIIRKTRQIADGK
jgi:hypothetical protein